MSKSKDYTAVSLPVGVLSDLNRMKIALSFTTGRLYTNGETVTELIRAVEKSNPALYHTFLNIKPEV